MNPIKEFKIRISILLLLLLFLKYTHNLQLWTDDSSAQNEVKNDSEDKENKNKSEVENKIKLWVRNPDLGNLIPGWILCHMFSVLVVILPGAFSKIGAQIFKLETDDAISIGIRNIMP